MRPKKLTKKHHFKRWQDVLTEGNELLKMEAEPDKAVVLNPLRLIDVEVTLEDALTSMRLNGAGNSRLCPWAIALGRIRGQLGHPYIGVCDVQRDTVYVGSKMTKKGKVTECYRYRLSGDAMKKLISLNDRPDGPAKVAAFLRKHGSQHGRLLPRTRRDWTKKGGTGRTDGSRSTVINAKQRKGAMRRHLDYLTNLNPPAMAAE